MPRTRVSPQIELEYEVIGSGRPLLLIGGLGSQLVSWDDRFCEMLVERGYQVIRFDNRDSGLSGGHESDGVPDLLGLIVGHGVAPYTLEEMAADSIALLDHLQIARADVVGLSLGGMIGQLMALRHPSRVASLVAALSGPPGRPLDLPTTEVVEALLRGPGATFEEMVEAAVDLRRALAGGGRDFDVEDARRRAALQIARAHRPDGTMRQAAAVLATRNQLDELSRLDVPVMVVHGEADPLVPFTSARAAAEAMPNARFVGVPGLGHDLPEPVALELIERIAEFHSRIAVAT